MVWDPGSGKNLFQIPNPDPHHWVCVSMFCLSNFTFCVVLLGTGTWYRDVFSTVSRKFYIGKKVIVAPECLNIQLFYLIFFICEKVKKTAFSKVNTTHVQVGKNGFGAGALIRNYGSVDIAIKKL
jgi:hypothetical protein